jgi:hypothetical protein
MIVATASAGDRCAGVTVEGTVEDTVRTMARMMDLEVLSFQAVDDGLANQTLRICFPPTATDGAILPTLLLTATVYDLCVGATPKPDCAAMVDVKPGPGFKPPSDWASGTLTGSMAMRGTVSLDLGTGNMRARDVTLSYGLDAIEGDWHLTLSRRRHHTTITLVEAAG